MVLEVPSFPFPEHVGGPFGAPPLPFPEHVGGPFGAPPFPFPVGFWRQNLRQAGFVCPIIRNIVIELLRFTVIFLEFDNVL